MKHFNKFLFSVVMVLTAMTTSAQTTFDFTEGNLKYRCWAGTSLWVMGLSDQAASSSSCSVSIPGKVTYNGTAYRVIGINDNAFKNQTNITSVEIRFGVTGIGASAFSGCTGITYVRMPSSITDIYDNAFAGCTGLTTVYYAGFNFPTGTIATSAFPSNSVMRLYVPYASKRTPTEYKSRTGFTQFTTVDYSPDAYDVYLSEGGLYSYGYSDLDGVTSTRSATLVGYRANASGTSSGTVYKPTAATYSYSTILPFSIDTIGKNAFIGQTTLTTIDLSKASNLKFFASQEENSGVQNVTKLVLPNSNFGFNTSSFYYFYSLPAFELAEGSNSYSIYDGCLYNKAQTMLYRVPNAKTGSMSYPATLTEVWTTSHARCTQITKAVLPYGVKKINMVAFSGCTSLSTIVIPSSVTDLSNSRVFANINPQAMLSINMPNPPTITASSYFGSTPSQMHLYIPYGKESVYSNAGWTGFSSVNINDFQAYDLDTLAIAYTVTSTESYTANDGNTYDGCLKVVCNGITGIDYGSTVNIPASVTYHGKNYAVTEIGDDAFNNRTSNFTVTGCVNVKEIGQYAFQNQPLKSYPFTHNLYYINKYAFDGTSLTGTVHIPYGVEYIMNEAFANGKYSRLVIPGSVRGLNLTFCKNTTTLQELVFNQRARYSNSFNYDLGTVPSTCYIRVPVGLVEHYKQNSSLSSRADYITPGAYDYVWDNNYTDRYFLSILSTTPITYNGETYAGTAKYVYHPYIKNWSGSYVFNDFEEDPTVDNDIRQYLITEIGDSCFAGAQFATSTKLPSAVTRIGHHAFYQSAYAADSLLLPSGLTTIGNYAFYGSKITGEVKIPASVTYIGDMSLHTTTLSSLYFPVFNDPITLGKHVWSGGSQRPVWVPNEYAYEYLNAVNSSWNSASVYASSLYVYIKPYASSVPFSSVVPTYMKNSDFDAYIVTGYDRSNPTQQATLTKVDHVVANTGMILTGLTPNKEYRIVRGFPDATAPETNYLVATASDYEWVDDQTVGYYWDGTAETPHFIRPTESYVSWYGQAYLLLNQSQASGIDDVYTNLWPKPGIIGDVTGEGDVDVSDVNAVINIILNKNTQADYPGNADVTGEGNIDVSDVNAIINIILHKN